jgi:predicted nucleic acid-binding protein
MIALDTNVIIAFFNDYNVPETQIIADMIDFQTYVLPPVVVSEFLSHPDADKAHIDHVTGMPTLKTDDGFWLRAGHMRAALIKKRYKPKLPDTLIAQSCIDHDVPLLSCDAGFQIYEKHCGLKLFQAL